MSHKKYARNAEICRRLDAGESSYALAREFGISRQRVLAIFERDKDRLSLPLWDKKDRLNLE